MNLDFYYVSVNLFYDYGTRAAYNQEFEVISSANVSVKSIWNPRYRLGGISVMAKCRAWTYLIPKGCWTGNHDSFSSFSCRKSVQSCRGEKRKFLTGSSLNAPTSLKVQGLSAAWDVSVSFPVNWRAQRSSQLTQRKKYSNGIFLYK